MLLQFSCSNHKSIKEPVLFSMIASKDSSHSKFLKKFKSFSVVRVASIYGANGSGKSNFVNALAFAKNLIVHSLSNSPGNALPQFPHKLSDSSTPSKYEFQFIKNDVRYAYGFSIKNFTIDEEYLYFFPNNRKTKIFERIGMKIIAGSKYKNSLRLSEDALKPNRLFLTCAANYSRNSEIENAFLFFNLDMVWYKASIGEPRYDNWYEYSINLMNTHPEIKEAFMELLKIFDTGIIDINTKVQEIGADDLEQIKKIISEDMQFLLNVDKNKLKNFQAKIIYDKFETNLMTEESTGIQQLFQIICPIIDILNNGRVFICDEIETGLHEKIVYRLVELFQYLMPDKFAQLIFTTHETGLLDLDLLRRDQIWFTQLTKERSTELYSLVELRNVRKNEDIANGYINGKYGAIPMLNKSFIDELNAWRENT